MKPLKNETKAKLTIKDNLKSLFNQKGYSLKSFFDETAWFLEKSNLKDKLSQPSTTPDESDDLISLLKELNLDKQGGLKVSVETFLIAITDYLMHIYGECKHFEKVIAGWNGEENKNLIEEVLNMLRKRIEKELEQNHSKITFRLENSAFFEAGDYEIELKTTNFVNAFQCSEVNYMATTFNILSRNKFTEFNTNDDVYIIADVDLEKRKLRVSCAEENSTEPI